MSGAVRLFLLLCAVTSGDGWLAAQEVPVAPAQLVTELELPLTRVAGIAPLSDGRYVVADSEERRIVLVDLQTGRTSDVGSRGQGPREFLWPFAPMALPDGSVWIYDLGNRRFLELDTDGETVRGRTWPEDQRFGGRAPPRGVDSAGRIYWEATPPFDGEISRHGHVVSWAPGASSVDPRVEILVRDAEGRKVLAALVTRDGWAVTPGGAIGVVRGEERRVEWHAPGQQPVIGPPLEIETWPVTEAELQSLADRPAGGLARTSGGEDADRNAAERVRTLRRDGWVTPETLPPFDTDRVVAGPDRTLWVQLRLPLAEPGTKILTFDERGRLARRIEIPERVDLLRVEEDGFLAVHTDDLGLQRLRRYRVD